MSWEYYGENDEIYNQIYGVCLKMVYILPKWPLVWGIDGEHSGSLQGVCRYKVYGHAMPLCNESYIGTL